jgi:ABC-2 type transport system ATP-binding protein
MISAQGLSKSYGEVRALDALSFEIGSGQIVGLLGPNGAGKTTTMRLLTTFLPADGGTATVAGFDIRKQSQDVRRSIGYLPENPPLYVEMKVREYLRFVAGIKGIERQRINAHVDEVLSTCALESVASRRCGVLSKGFRQRVGIAQALVHKPAVVILDEPTNGLDPTQVIEVRALIGALAPKQTVVLSTHILQEVMQLCSNVVMIARGRTVIEGRIEEMTREKSLEQCFLEAVNA